MGICSYTKYHYLYCLNFNIMKNLKLILISVLYLLVFISCEKDLIDTDLLNEKSTELNSNSEVNKKKNDSKLQNRVVYSPALKFNVIENPFTRKVQIYTPPGYKKNGSQQYPVVYLLHGLPFSEKAFIDIEEWDEWIDPNGLFTTYPDFPEEGFRLWVDNLIAQGLIEPMIIVMPDASTIPYGFSFYTNSALNGNFEDFVVYDLVNYMDKHYNTIPNANGRAVIGLSQGGYGAFKFGMFHPEVFRTIASHSGLLNTGFLFGDQFLEMLKLENPDGFTGPDPAKFLTSALYAMSAAWSPNLMNPPFFVDLPLEFQADGSLTPVMDVVLLWLQNDVYTLIDSYTAALKSLNGIYLDVGMYDELGTQLAHEPLIEKLEDLNITYNNDTHIYTYFGGHTSSIFERLAVSLEFCSEKMQ